MGKLLLFIISCFFVIAGYSQHIQFGGTAGLNFSGAIVKYPTYEVSGAHPSPGFEVGVFADIPLDGKMSLFSFRPSLSYSLERASAVVEGDKAKIHISFIKVPLLFMYHSNAMQKRLSFGVGPYIAYNLGGKYDWANTRVQSISFGSNQADYGRTYKKIDIGTDLQGVYQLNEQLALGAKFDLGLINMIHTTEDPDAAKSSKIHTISLAFTVAYTFGTK
jgi:hypothetical protein